MLLLLELIFPCLSLSNFATLVSVPVFYGSVPVLCSVLLLQFKKFNCGWEVTALMLDTWFQVSTNFHESSYNIRR